MAEATWTSISVESEGLTALVENTTEVIDALGTSVGAIAKLLNKIVSLLDFGVDFLTSVVKKIMSVIKNAIDDILNTGVFACAHSNLKYDPDWVLRDWTVDGKPPFGGTGLKGWLTDVAVSSMDEENPYAPLPDDDQPMAAILITKGVNIEFINDLAPTVRAVQGLMGMNNPKDPINLIKESTDNIGSIWESLLEKEEGRAAARMGALEDYTKDQWRTITDSVESALEGTVQAGKPTLRLSVGNPSWYSAKVSDILGPGISEVFSNLQKLVDQFTSKESSPLADLLSAVALYLEKLRSVLKTVSGLVATVDDLINSLLTMDFCVVPLDSEARGMGSLVSKILTAEDVPDYGSDGVVFGMMMGFQGADLSAFTAVGGLFQFLGIDLGASFANYLSEYQDAWTDMTGEITSAWSGTSLVNKAPEWSSPTRSEGDLPLFAFSVTSGTTPVGTVTAVSPNTPASNISYSISGGRDRYHSAGSIGVQNGQYDEGASIFSVDSNGVVSFISAPSFENPTAAVPGNVYRVRVQANDSVDQRECVVEITVTSS